VVIELHGIKPQYFGFVFASNAIGLIAASQVNARLVVRRSAERVLGKVLWVPAGLSLVVALLVLAVWKACRCCCSASSVSSPPMASPAPMRPPSR
jgi:DHA1 family bicyclomycin/chloramphenicol resistance-like MFS transporter